MSSRSGVIALLSSSSAPSLHGRSECRRFLQHNGVLRWRSGSSLDATHAPTLSTTPVMFSSRSTHVEMRVPHASLSPKPARRTDDQVVTKSPYLDLGSRRCTRRPSQLAAYVPAAGDGVRQSAGRHHWPIAL